MTTRRPDIYPPPRIEFGLRLREARETVPKLQSKDLAEKIGISGDLLSRFETGKRWPKRPLVEEIARAVNLDAASTAELLQQYDEAAAQDRILKSTAPYRPRAAQAERNKLLADAAEVSTFAVTEIPFYLQTLEYARQEIGDVPDADAIANMRVDAGKHVGSRGKAFDILVTEAALRFLPCDKAAMQGQISRLHGLIGTPGVKFGIIPFGVELVTPLKNAFSVFDETTMIDTFAGELTLTPKQASRYTDLIARLAGDAVRDEAARALLTAAMNALPNS